MSRDLSDLLLKMVVFALHARTTSNKHVIFLHVEVMLVKLWAKYPIFSDHLKNI